jgi:hypothetical protein
MNRPIVHSGGIDSLEIADFSAQLRPHDQPFSAMNNHPIQTHRHKYENFGSLV